VKLDYNTSKVLIANTILRPFNVSAGVRQDDAFSAILFNISLNVVFEGTAEKGNFTYKFTHVCAYHIIIIIYFSINFQLVTWIKS
jgi:hypothetical protein